MQTKSRCLARIAAILVYTCVYLPRQTLVYDHDCKISAEQLVLEGGEVARAPSTHNGAHFFAALVRLCIPGRQVANFRLTQN